MRANWLQFGFIHWTADYNDEGKWLSEEEDDFDFNERFTKLKTEFEAQLKEEERLNRKIIENFAKIELKDE